MLAGPCPRTPVYVYVCGCMFLNVCNVDTDISLNAG